MTGPQLPKPSRRRTAPNADDHAPTTPPDAAPGSVDATGVPPLRFSRAASAPTDDAPEPRPTAPDKTVKPGVLSRKITDLYGQAGFIVGAFDPVCGQAIIANAQQIGVSLEAAAKESPEFRKWLEGLFKTNVWIQVTLAHAPIAAAIAAHHVPMFRDKVNEQMVAAMANSSRNGEHAA